MIQEDRTNIELLIKTIREQKTTLPSLRNQDWKKIKLETEKVKGLQHIPTDITDLNEIIDAGAKLDRKPGLEVRLEDK